MLVCRDESIEFSSQDRGTIGPRVQAWVAEMEQRGVRLLGDVPAPVDATVTVSVRDGKVDVEHGPRVETSAPAWALTCSSAPTSTKRSRCPRSIRSLSSG